MEGSSPEDLSVGPSVINRSRTIHMEGRRTPRKKKKDSKTEDLSYGAFFFFFAHLVRRTDRRG